jgi:hypothetical protein
VCAPRLPQTQGKIERWHQTLHPHPAGKPGHLDLEIEAFIEHYNHQRYHESLGNVTPADAYFGRDRQILAQRPPSRSRPSNIAACNTASSLPKTQTLTRPALRYRRTKSAPNVSTTDRA